MPRYAAFLRGVSPTNCKMPELREAFEAAGFTDVRTLLSSGNVVFDARAAQSAVLQRKAEAAMEERLGKAFMAVVRPIAELEAILAADPYAGTGAAPSAKRVVTFLREPPAKLPQLPIERDGASILKIEGLHVFSAYLPSPKGPVFMQLLEQAFGKAQTTRTWQTLQKVAAA